MPAGRLAVALVVATATVPAGGGAWGNGGGGGFKTVDDFDRAKFPAAPFVDNKFLPLTPAMIYSFIGTSNLEHGAGVHRIIYGGRPPAQQAP